jgi:hypothetical protein
MDLDLAADPDRDPGGQQHAQLRELAQPAIDQRADDRDLLDVVEGEDDGAVPEGPGHDLGRFETGAPEAKSGHDCRRHRLDS